MERKKSKKTKRPRAVRDLTTRKAGPIKGKAGASYSERRAIARPEHTPRVALTNRVVNGEC